MIMMLIFEVKRSSSHGLWKDMKDNRGSYVKLLLERFRTVERRPSNVIMIIMYDRPPELESDNQHQKKQIHDAIINLNATVIIP